MSCNWHLWIISWNCIVTRVVHVYHLMFPGPLSYLLQLFVWCGHSEKLGSRWCAIVNLSSTTTHPILGRCTSTTTTRTASSTWCTRPRRCSDNALRHCPALPHPALLSCGWGTLMQPSKVTHGGTGWMALAWVAVHIEGTRLRLAGHFLTLPLMRFFDWTVIFQFWRYFNQNSVWSTSLLNFIC